jgi:hypothetical protein
MQVRFIIMVNGFKQGDPPRVIIWSHCNDGCSSMKRDNVVGSEPPWDNYHTVVIAAAEISPGPMIPKVRIGFWDRFSVLSYPGSFHVFLGNLDLLGE